MEFRSCYPVLQRSHGTTTEELRAKLSKLLRAPPPRTVACAVVEPTARPTAGPLDSRFPLLATMSAARPMAYGWLRAVYGKHKHKYPQKSHAFKF